MLAELSPEKTKIEAALTPGKIMHIGMGFWASQALLTAVKLELFTLLAHGLIVRTYYPKKIEAGLFRQACL